MRSAERLWSNAECHHEYLLAFSCKQRGLRPSCHAKRQAVFGEFLTAEILEAVPHRHVVLSLPRATVPRAVACLQSAGSLLDWHPHVHLLITWGVFRRDGGFVPVAVTPDPETVARLFRHKVLRFLLAEGAIADGVARSLVAWPHTGFGTHVSRAIPTDDRTPGVVARYMARPPITRRSVARWPSCSATGRRAPSTHSGIMCHRFPTSAFTARKTGAALSVRDAPSRRRGWCAAFAPRHYSRCRTA